MSWNKDELRYIDALVERLGGHNEYRDAIGCYLGELVARNFPGAEWVPGHALGPAVRVNGRHVFPLGWVYRRADGAYSVDGRPFRSLPAHLLRQTIGRG